MKLLSSKFDGTCAAGNRCIRGVTTRKGQMIYWHKDNNGSKVWHKECAEAMVSGQIQNNLPLNHGIPAGGASPSPTTPQAVPLGGNKPRSCENCPNLVAPQDAALVFGSPINSYMCKARGLVITGPMTTPVELATASEELAKDCAQYGSKADSLPDHFESRVGVRPGFTIDQNRVPPNACTDCKHYAKPETVMAELNWGTGMCTAQGKLIVPSALVKESLRCGMGEAGSPAGDVTRVQLLPRFAGSASAALAPDPQHTARNVAHSERIAMRMKHEVDPRDYVTDKPVSPADEAAYIKAWRKIEDPDGYGEAIWLPIFDGPKLMAHECKAKMPGDTDTCTNPICGDHDPRRTYGNHRPDLYIDHDDLLYNLAATMVGADFTPLFEGPSGSGKTEAAVWWAWLMDLPIVRVPVSKGTQVYHLSGEKELMVDPISGQVVTSYRMGRVSNWYDRSCVIIVDEANLQPDVWEFLRSAADGAQQLMLDDAQGIVVTRGNATFLIFTQNPSWDPVYVGAEPISAADMQRVAPIWFDYPDPEIERQIITKHCEAMDYQISPRTVDQILKVSAEVRGMQETIQMPWGIRSNIKVAKFSKFMRLPVAYKRALLDGCESEVVNVINQAINAAVT